MEKIPDHVAIIMDGNRRWARRRALPLLVGHRKGVQSIKKVMEGARDAGVKILTLYTFSTENWKRSEREVSGLMKLIEEYLDNEYKQLIENDIKLNTIGREDRFPRRLLKKLAKIKELTRNNSSLLLNLALDYGARDEIVTAVRKIAGETGAGGIELDDIDEDLFSKNLFTGGLPDPDLLIRTGGEFRVSNFLLWQISYSEIYVTNKLWPDFGKLDFIKAIEAFRRRDRRAGE